MRRSSSFQDIFLIIASLLLLFSSAIYSVTSPSELSCYPQFCMEAASNEQTFSNFKRAPVYTEVLEHVSYEKGQEYLSYVLQQSPEFQEKLNLFRENDLLGNPYAYSYGAFGTFSPTTLRYIKVASEITKIFGSLNNLHIVEIGGGYGGQCFILSKLYTFASYTIIDLPGPLALTKKYLHTLGVENVTFLTPDMISTNQSYDFAISNYAFSECNTQVQEDYLNKVLSKSTRGYLTCNYEKVGGIIVLTKSELLQKLNEKKIVCKELPEEPSTGNTNYLVVWPSTPS